MEVLGQGLASIGNALGSIGGWAGFVCVVGIAASTFLVYTGKVTLDELKDLFHKGKDGRYR